MKLPCGCPALRMWMQNMSGYLKLELRFPTGEPITYPFGIRNFYVADPEGNLIEIGSTNET